MTVLSLEVAGSPPQQKYDDQIRLELQCAKGGDIKSIEGRYLATFKGPTRALQCAMAIRDRMKETGHRIRAAIHIGECEKRADDLEGLAIRLASRLVELAE